MHYLSTHCLDQGVLLKVLFPAVCRNWERVLMCTLTRARITKSMNFEVCTFSKAIIEKWFAVNLNVFLTCG